MDTIFDGEVPRARLALLLRHFSELKDNREPWRIVYPLQEVLLLVTCATIASCDDFDDIVAWGKHHLVFLRHFSEFHHGIPCERWLRALLNRIDPILFGRCFNSWIAALWPNRHEFIAIDGKTSRRTHDELVSKTTVEKGHGRIETRTYSASKKVDWITSERSYPGQPRFKNIKTIAKVHARAEYSDRCSFDTHHYISSAPLDIERIARGARGHWGVESMHWLLDVEFKDDLSRYRTGHGAKNMTIVRRFALGLVRANKAKGSVKTRRKTAGWSPDFLLEILQLK